MNWKQWLALGLFSFSCFLLGALISYHTPRLEAWFLVTIEKQTQRVGPARVLPQDLKLEFLPFSLHLKKVQILPKEELAKTLSPFVVEDLTIRPNLFSLLSGQLEVDDLKITGARVQVKIEDVGKSEEKFNYEALWTEPPPLSRLHLEDVHVQITIPEKNQVIAIKDLSLKNEFFGRQVTFEIDAPWVGLSSIGRDPHISFRIGTRGFLAEKNITLSSLIVQKEELRLISSGSFELNESVIDGYQVQARLQAPLDKLKHWSEQAGLDLVSLSLDGQLKMDLQLKGGRLTEIPAAEFFVHLEKGAIEGYHIGTLTTEGTLTDGVFTVPRTQIRNNAGTVAINNLKGRWLDGGGIEFNSRLNARSVELSRLLANLTINNVPVQLYMSGDLPCGGKIGPASLNIECQGQLSGQKLNVFSKSPEKPIVRLNDFLADGKVTITDKDVSYKAKLKVGQSHGESDGVISYEKGFKINYKTPELKFSDIETLIGLQFEGSTRIEGNTQGTSSWATIDMNLNAKDFVIEDYFLGETGTNLRYKSGQLYFDKFTALVGNSRFNGNFSIDLAKESIRGRASAAYVEAPDIQKIFTRLIELPFPLTGTGNAEIHWNGPLDFWRLSYQLKSAIYRGQIANEIFDELRLNVTSKSGLAKAENVFIRRGKSKIQFDGQVDPQQRIRGTLHGQGLRLEDSDRVSKLGLNLSGLVDLSLSLDGDVFSPRTELKTHIRKVTIANKPKPNSDLHLIIDKSEITGDASLFEGQVQSEFKIPLEKGRAFSFKGKANKWDFASFISAFDESLPRLNFTSEVTGEMSLDSPTGDFWLSNGSVQVGDLKIQRGALAMGISRPIRIEIEEGRVKVQSFLIEGENSFVRVTSPDRPSANLDVHIEGKIAMPLMMLATPFLEDLRGLLSFSVRTQAARDRFDLLGSAYIDEGFVKLHDFPHPAEDIRADVLFSQKQIFINSIRGRIAGGRLLGNGQVLIRDYFDLPTEVKLQFENVRFKIPDGIETQGNGQIRISGNWFPFEMSGEYRVRGGMVSKEFDSSTETKPVVRRRYFLPELLSQKRFNPLTLNLEVKTQNPVEVKNSLIQGTATADLVIKGAIEKPLINGRIRITENSKIMFRDKEFTVQTANIQMKGREDMNPDLFITAGARIGEYDISLLVQGTAETPEIRLTSQPPLAESEIVSLLALGFTSEKIEENVDFGDRARQSTYQIGSAILIGNPIGREIKERFGWDLQLSSAFDDENNAAVPRITVFRQITPKIGAAASYESGKEPKTDVKVKYQFTPSFSLVGSLENTEFDNTVQTNESKEDFMFGLDLEYRLEFK